MARKPTPPEMIKPEEAARRLGVTPNYLRQEIRKGTFPVGWAFKPNDGNWVYCIPRAAFENLMSGNSGAEQIAELVAAKIIEQLKGRDSICDTSNQPWVTSSSAS